MKIRIPNRQKVYVQSSSISDSSLTASSHVQRLKHLYPKWKLI
ncbi:unnamed protein product, partial [Staurois parvus]